jgi:hypothetical protein|tara:strand:+ start:4344 stop:4880 length:537 start_codon:yes stop_codon:yes gene_type:complete
MWARIESNAIVEILNRPKALTIGDVKYPSNIFSLWSNSELAGIGLYPVTVDSSNLKDKEYYLNTDVTYTWDNSAKTCSGAYGSATAKTLADLKTAHKEIINSQAAGNLEPTDWMVVRAAEGGTAVPSDTTTKRAAVRTKANSMCVQIDGAADVDALAALYVYNDADPAVRPLGELPTV